MNKKISWVFILAICLSLVSAGILTVSSLDKDKFLDKDKKDALTSLSLDFYNVTDYEGGDTVTRCLKRVDIIEIPCEFGEGICYSTVSRINTCQDFSTLKCETYDEEIDECTSYVSMTEEEVNNILDSWETRRIESIADAKISRDAIPVNLKVNEGQTTIKEKSK